jgi:hypothetical protein
MIAAAVAWVRGEGVPQVHDIGVMHRERAIDRPRVPEARSISRTSGNCCTPRCRSVQRMTRLPVSSGECKLCRTVGPLRNSHVIPSWAYERARTPEGPVRDPLTVEEGSIYATSKQIVEPLLCDACEVRFAEFDRYVATLAYSAECTSPMPKLLGYAKDTRAQVISIENKIDSQKLLRFGLSVVWRAHASASLDADLGKFAGGIRRYLLDQDRLPDGVHIVVNWYHDEGQILRRHHLLDRTTIHPQVNRHEGIHLHWFMVCGLKFEVSVGSRPHPPSMVAMCLHCSSERIWVRNWHESGQVSSVQAVAIEAKPRGKWAKKQRDQ